jgi:hypothetical protein
VRHRRLKHLPAIRKIPDDLWDEIKLLLPPEKANNTIGTFRGNLTGQNPTDRSKSGTKRHVLLDRIEDLRGRIHKAHKPIYNETVMIEIETLQWVLSQIDRTKQ